MEDEDKDMVYEDSHFVPLVGGLLLHLEFLTRIWWSGSGDGSGGTVARIREGATMEIGS